MSLYQVRNSRQAAKFAKFGIESRITNRALHNFRFTLEPVPLDELEGVKKFLARFDVK